MANAFTLIPWITEQVFDFNGKPLAGGLLFTYAAGTSTKLTTFAGASPGDAAQSNPIVLDSSGQPPFPIFLQARTYKFVLAPAGDTDPPTSPLKTVDNVPATPPFNVDLDVAGIAGEALGINDLAYLSAGDGSRTAGTWYKADSDLTYASTTARVMGFVLTSASAGEALTVRRMGRVTSLSGLTAGSLYYVSSTAGGITLTPPTNPRRVGQADTTTSLIVAAEIPDPVKGYIPLDLSVGRILSGSATQNAAANGGLSASDSAPIYQRVNAGTDKALRLNWAATVVAEVTWSFTYPPDLDDTAAVDVHLLAAMSGNTNAPVISIAYFEGVGDGNAGGNTGAITGTALADYSVTIAATDVGAHPNCASVSLVPAAHATDAFYLYGAWIEYTRKLLAT